MVTPEDDFSYPPFNQLYFDDSLSYLLRRENRSGRDDLFFLVKSIEVPCDPVKSETFKYFFSYFDVIARISSFVKMWDFVTLIRLSKNFVLINLGATLSSGSGSSISMSGTRGPLICNPKNS